MRTRARTFRATIAVGAVAAAALGLVATGSAAADEGGVESVPVSFEVVTKNRSGVPCLNPPGEKRVTVRGHLTGPTGRLGDGGAVAVYAHGNGYGEFFWRFDDPRYDYAGEMAERGHVSLTVDRVGYDDSDKPNGNTVCFGTEADVLHQVIDRLREGDYGGDQSPSFDRVALVGHSAGGFIVNQVAYGFGGVDALGVLSSGAASSKPLVVQRTGEMQLRCLLDGDGYAPLEANDAQFRADHIHNVEDDVADELTDRRNDDACAGTRNAGSALAADLVRNATIDVPVLVMVGSDDEFFGPPEPQGALYVGSPEVTTRTIPDTGHAIAFSRNSEVFRDEMDRWLSDNDF